MPYKSSQSSNPIWIPLEYVVEIHNKQIEKYGGCVGISNEALLDSALNKPKNNWYYGESLTIFDLAALYACGLAQAHAFVDGNKRTAFVTASIFLELNGYSLEIEKEDEINQMMVEIASRKVSEAEVANWLRSNSQKKTN